jgi:hypothetical protein
VINHWNVGWKNHDDEDNAEPDGGAEEHISERGKQSMSVWITSNRAVRLAEDLSTTWEVHRPRKMTWHGCSNYLQWPCMNWCCMRSRGRWGCHWRRW